MDLHHHRRTGLCRSCIPLSMSLSWRSSVRDEPCSRRFILPRVWSLFWSRHSQKFLAVAFPPTLVMEMECASYSHHGSWPKSDHFSASFLARPFLKIRGQVRMHAA